MPLDKFKELQKTIREFKDKFPTLQLDNAFIGWYLHSFVTGNEDEAFSAIVGGPGDKGADAIYIDKETKSVFIIQGKYNQSKVPCNTKLQDVMGLANLGRTMLVENSASFDILVRDANNEVQDKLKEARKKIQRDEYRLILKFITTGKISKTQLEQGEQIVEDWENASFEGISRIDLFRLMQDYLEGIAPPVLTLRLPIQGEELFNKFDDETDISSWVFSVNGKDLGDLFNKVGIRIFARNIRGFLGNTSINEEIKKTLDNEPEYFWYFNNGITIICDEARQISERKGKYLEINNAQIINGQQTTRTLAEIENGTKANVLVKVIAVARKEGNTHENFTKLVGEIVRATNHQNAISASDLMSNEIEQIRIEREFKKYKYQYIRKRQTKREAMSAAGFKPNFAINKTELAQRIVACHFDPSIVRLGKDKLFEEDQYFKIFNIKHIEDYFVYYWLGRNVFRQTKTVMRGYAKWLILNYTWNKIGTELLRPMNRKKFRIISERYYREDYEKTLKPLFQVINKLFVVSSLFYRKNKISDRGSVLDESSFFRKQKLDIRLEKFLNKNKYSWHRKFVNDKFKEFLNNINNLEIN